MRRERQIWAASLKPKDFLLASCRGKTLEERW